MNRQKTGELGLMVDFLNTEGPLQTELREILRNLITRPDPMVIDHPLTGADHSVMLSNYCSSLMILLGNINSVLGSDLRITLGTEKVWRSTDTGEVYPMNSEITWARRGKGLISNPDYGPHIADGKGVIRIPWGKLMVVGDLPSCPTRRMSQRYRWYRVLAESLLSGEFSRLRLCRPKLNEQRDKGCNKVFLTSRTNTKRSFCSKVCERKWSLSHRGEELGRNKKNAEKEKVSAVLSWFKNQIRAVKARDLSDLIDKLPVLVLLRDHLGNAYDDFEPAVIKIYEKDIDPKVMVGELSPRVRKKLSTFNPSEGG